MPVGVDGAGLVAFRAAYDDTVCSDFFDSDEHIRIDLCVRCQSAVTLRVCHCTVYDQIVFLYEFQEFFESFMVVCAVFLIDFIGGGVLCVERVHADTSLKARSSLLSAESLHLYFFL